MSRLPARGWTAGLLLLVGANAVVAGCGFIGDPDGSAVGIPQDWLGGTPFRDYLVPGILLTLLGLLALAAAVLQLRRSEFAWAWAIVAGLGFVGWIIVQASLMGSFRHPMQTLLQAAVLALALAVVVLAFWQYRRWHLRWGATDEEFRAPMPGDELVPRPAFDPTRAVTIDAPPEEVWPWIAQMGHGRAGFYSYDRLDNSGRPSLDAIDPRLQDLRQGDWIPMSKTVTEDTAFKVASLDPPRSMVWAKRDSTWAWSLRPLPGGRTRLVARIRLRYERNRLLPVSLLLMEGGDFVMMRRCLLGIKRRAERARAGGGPGPRAGTTGRGRGPTGR